MLMIMAHSNSCKKPLEDSGNACWIVPLIQWAIPCSYCAQWFLKGFFLGCWTMWSHKIMSEIELMAMSDLKLLYWEARGILCFFTKCDSSLNHRSQHAVHHCSITLLDVCELPFTAVKCIKLKIEWRLAKVRWIFGKTNDPCCPQWACSFKPWEMLSVCLFPTATQACIGLMDGSFSLAIYHVMSIHSRKENMFIFR